MALGSTQPLREAKARNFSVGKARPRRKGDNLIAMCELGALSCNKPMGLHGLLQE
jgi:hypothetical protein